MSAGNRLIKGTTSNGKYYEVSAQFNAMGDLEEIIRIHSVKIDGLIREDIKLNLDALTEKQIHLKIEHLLSLPSTAT